MKQLVVRRDGLPVEILYEIFHRLPSLEPVHRFRCVSKLWNSLLSDPSFMTKMYNIIRPWFLIYEPNDHQIPLFQAHHSKFISQHDGFTFKFDRKVRLLDSCSNGLVLYTTHDVDFRNASDFYICNPLTKQSVSLPPRPHNVGNGFPKLVCDQSLASSTTILGCNFKVVYTSRCEVRRLKNFEIFSSDTGKWNTHEVDRYTKLPEEMVIRNGVLYWTDESEETSTSKLILVAYRLENKINNGDRCRSIDFPMCGNNNHYHLYQSVCRSNHHYHPYIRNGFLGEAEGSIYYGHIYGTGPNTASLSTWLLEDDYSNEGLVWCVHKKIEVKGYGPSRKIEFMSFNPVDRNVVIIVDRGCYLAFNIETNTFEILSGCPISTKGNVLLITPKPTIIKDWRLCSTKERRDEGRGSDGFGGEHCEGDSSGGYGGRREDGSGYGGDAMHELALSYLEKSERRGRRRRRAHGR